MNRLFAALLLLSTSALAANNCGTSVAVFGTGLSGQTITSISANGSTLTIAGATASGTIGMAGLTAVGSYVGNITGIGFSDGHTMTLTGSQGARSIVFTGNGTFQTGSMVFSSLIGLTAGFATSGTYLQFTGSGPVGGSSLLSCPLAPGTITAGWNLLGGETIADLAHTFPAASVASVWAWDKPGNRWRYYSGLQADGGVSYAAAHNMAALTALAPAEGFWVNASADFILDAQ